MEVVVNELGKLMVALGGDSGWITMVAAWMGVLRLVFKWVSSRLQSMVEQKTHQDIILSVMKTKAYRMTSFLIDLLMSIKLPQPAEKVLA